MNDLIKQSSTSQPLLFLLVQSSDHLTGLTGASPTVTLSKNGGSFGSPSGAVSEIGYGWYQVAANATDNNTLGPLVLHASAAGADPTDHTFNVVAFDPQAATNLGLSAIPTASPGASGGAMIAGSNAATTLASLTVSGATTLSGAVSLGSTLGVTGAVTFGGSIAVAGTVTFNALAVTTTTTLSGAVSLGATLGITGAVTLASTLGVSGLVTLNALTVTNNTTLSGNLTISGTVSGLSTLTQAQVLASPYPIAVDSNGRVQLQYGTSTGQVSASGGIFNVNMAQIDGQATTASGGVTFPTSIAANNEIRSGTAQGGTSGGITLDSGASSTNSFYNGENIELVGGTGVGQTRQITGYVGSTKVATVGTPWVVNPDSTSQFKVLSSAAGGSVNVGSISSGAITSAAFASGAVAAASLFQVDGLAIDSAMIAMLATLLGETTVSGNTVDFKKQDGSTTKVAITYGSTAGQRTGSAVS